MVSIWFKIVSDGDYKGSILFYNQVITQGFQIHNCNELLRKMVEESGAKSTDLQSPESVEHLCAKCDAYAEHWAPKAEELFPVKNK